MSYLNVAFALELQRQGTQIFVASSQCEEVDQLALALEGWATQAGHSCSLTKEHCQVEISHCLPQKSARFLGLEAKKAGPNCHNLALVMNGTLPALRYTDYMEVKSVLDSPLCQSVDRSQVRAGDIGRIGNGIEAHSFIYLADSLVITKNGLDRSEFTIQTQVEMLNLFASNRDDIRYHRCQSMDSYLKNKILATEYKNVLGALDRYEAELECRALNGESGSLYDLQEFVASNLAVLANYANDSNAKLIENSTSEEELYLLASLNSRLDSLAQISSEYDQSAGFISHFSDSAPDVSNIFEQLKRVERRLNEQVNPSDYYIGF